MQLSDGELIPTLQNRTRPHTLCTREEARRDIFATIEGFTIERVRHSAIDISAPIDMELKAA